MGGPPAAALAASVVGVPVPAEAGFTDGAPAAPAVGLEVDDKGELGLLMPGDAGGSAHPGAAAYGASRRRRPEEAPGWRGAHGRGRLTNGAISDGVLTVERSRNDRSAAEVMAGHQRGTLATAVPTG